MNTEELFYELAGRGRVPSGELREAMFEFHNSMVGKSKYIKRTENPKTRCGSCIQRVMRNVFNWYHFDEGAPTYEGIYFSGKFGIGNIPLYKRK